MTRPASNEPRPYCYRCDKPVSMCLCQLLTPIPNGVGIHVLQHPRERHHPLGTARLLRLGLASVKVHVLDLHGMSAAVRFPPGAGLLYPSADARDLSVLPTGERPEHLVVIDGTWAQANRIFKDNPWIAALPRYRLDPEEGSRYRIRAEPRLECLSTVESVVAALRCLEPDLPGTETLDAAFDAMIDAQIAASARASTHAPGQRPRQTTPQPVPAAMRAPDARIVAVYAEAAPPRGGGARSRTPVRLCAVSLDGVRVFDRMMQASAVPDAYETALMGLEDHHLASARPPAEVLAAFHDFCEAASQPPPVLVAWNVWTQRWLEQRVTDATSVLLKGVWANISKARVPSLDKLVKTLELGAVDLPVPGRAGVRLSNTLVMARHIVDGTAVAR